MYVCAVPTEINMTDHIEKNERTQQPKRNKSHKKTSTALEESRAQSQRDETRELSLPNQRFVGDQGDFEDGTI
jgi:hypothetical protein